MQLSMDLHWFGSLDPDPHWDKKLDPDLACIETMQIYKTENNQVYFCQKKQELILNHCVKSAGLEFYWIIIVFLHDGYYCMSKHRILT